MSTPERSLLQPQAQEQIAVAGGRARTLLDQARQVKIVDAVSREFAIDLRGQIKAYQRQLDTNRTALVKPLNDHVKRINAGFQAATVPLDEAVTVVDAEIVRDRREQERIAADARRKADEEAAEKRRQEEERLRREAEAAGFDKAEAKEVAQLVAADVPVTVAPTPPAPLKTATTLSGSRATVRKVWTFEVLNPEVVPRAFLAIDTQKVRQAIRDGVRVIDGLRIYETEQVAG